MQKTMRRFFYCLLAMTVSFFCKGQSNNTLGDRANSSTISSKQKGHSILPHDTKRKRLLFRRPSVKHTPEYEFYKRIETAAKEKQRIMRKMAKPQYANMQYFGHKHRPKKNLPYKMKYCKECGIRH